MAVTVTIMPAFVMGVLPSLRDDLLEQSAQIADGPAFVFDGCQCRGRGGTKDRGSAIFESALENVSGNLIGNVVNVRVAARAERNGGGLDCHEYHRDSKVCPATAEQTLVLNKTATSGDVDSNDTLYFLDGMP